MELIKKEDEFSVAIKEIENTRKMCEMLLNTPHYSRIGKEGIYAILAKAKSLDMDPIDALNGSLYYVQGRVGMSTEAMASRMRQAGHSISKDPKSGDSICILHGKRKDTGDTWITTFSIEDAKRAGIYQERGPWGKYPSVMCYNRAMSMMFRQLTPDLSKGVGYTLDELKEISGESLLEPEEEKKVEVITKEQAEELNEFFSECDPKYVAQVWHTLNKPPISIHSLEELPITFYERIKSAALKNRTAYQETLKKEEELKIEEYEEEWIYE